MKEYRTAVSDNQRWANFTHRPGDIFVCTPAKCGTTWMQTIVASLLFPDGNFPGIVIETFAWIEARFDPIDEMLPRLEAQTHRRCMKSHTPADGIPWFDDAKYIVVGRDGRDAFMSWTNHAASMREDLIAELNKSAVTDGITPFPPFADDVHAWFGPWLAGGALFEHILSFWERRDRENVLFVHYNDLKADLEGEMRRVAEYLEFEVSEALWPAVVERCTFDAMKSRGSQIGDFDRLFDGGSDSFIHKGTNGRWRDVLTTEELAAYDKRVAEALPADAARWLEFGHAALPV
jgi:aryl sulfotransferase